MKTVCFGDSITWGYTPEGGRYRHPWPDILQSCRQNDEFINEGMPGRTAFGSAKPLAMILHKHRPDLTIIMLGSNDLSQDCCRDIPEVVSDLEDLGKEAEKHGKVLLLAPPIISEDVDAKWGYHHGISMEMKQLADEIRFLCHRNKWLYFNTQNIVEPAVPDGLHLNESSHLVLGKEINRFLNASNL